MIKRQGLGLFTKLLTGASALSFSVVAVAQEQPTTSAAANVGIKANQPAADIIVTATRRAESLRDVPMSINVATGEQIERLKILDVKDVQQLAPGLELTNTTGRNNVATLRGISFDPDQGTRPSVDLYFNEIPVDPQTAFTAIYDIDQIEVLRGPQGSLRGRTSPAGAITLRTRRPNLSEQEGYFQATGTEDHAFNFQAGVSSPIVTDKLAVRLSGLYDGNRLNQVRNIHSDEFSRSRTKSGRVSLAWQPFQGLTANLMYQYLLLENRTNQQVFGPGNAAIGNPPISVDERLAVHEGPITQKNSTHLVTADIDWDLGPVSLAFVGGHQDTKLTNEQEFDQGNAVHNYAPGQHGVIPYNVDTAELRIVSNNKGFWNWTVGAYYSNQKQFVVTSGSNDVLRADPGDVVPDSITLGRTNIQIPLTTETLAFAASSRFEFTDQLTLEVGARYSINKQDSQLILVLPSGPLVLLSPSAKTKPLTGGATLTYKVNPDLTVYAAYGRSHRPGGLSFGLSFVPIDPNLLTPKDETSNSFEVGLKTSLLDRRLSLETAIFYQKFNNFISRFNNIPTDQGTRGAFGFSGLPDGSIDAFNPFTYSGDATVKGIEMTLAGKPVDSWDFSLSASYVKARYDDAQLPCTTLAGGSPVIIGGGNVSYCNLSRLADVPDFSLTANTEIRFPMGGAMPFVRGLLNYRPSVLSERNFFDYPSRVLLNMFVGVRDLDSKWELSVFARNLLNQNRITNISASNAQVVGRTPANKAVFFDSGYRTINTTNPREFGISASYRF